MNLRRTTTALGTAALGLALSLTTPAPAQAHAVAISHGNDHADVWPAHHDVVWCDRESDGNRVRVAYITAASYPFHNYTDADPNGANPGCGHHTTISEIIFFALCEDNVSCTGWFRT